MFQWSGLGQLCFIQMSSVNFNPSYNIEQPMIQQQELEKAITKLNQSAPKASALATFKSIKVIVKTLDQYFQDPQVYPSERFIPCCLFTLPQKFCEILGVPDNSFLQEKPQKMAHKLVLQTFLKSMLKLLGESSEEIKHIVVEGISRAIVLVGPYLPIAKRWVKALLQLWSTCSENLNISLRCHLALAKYLGTCDPAMYMWGLRRMYVEYFEHCKQVSWRNFEHINFMINSMCEIVKINTERAYYVLFGYLRSIALELDKLHKSKRKERVDQTAKLFSNQILNCFKLFAALVSRVEAEELTALIYPLCELLAAYERVSENPQYIPLKLHLLEQELSIIQALGLYIPHAFELIEKLLQNPIFNKKLSKKSQKVEANIQLAYKISKDQLKQAHLINQLFRSLMTKVHKFNYLASKHSFGPELQQKLVKILKKQNYSFSEYKIQCKNAHALIKADSETVYDLRANEKMSLQSAKKIKKFQEKLRETSLEGDHKYKELREEEEDIMKKKLAAEDEEPGSQGQQESAREDEDEVNSGWEEASEGASEFEMESQEEQSGPVEEISYEGDPEDVDEVAKQWSEEEWDSQENIGDD